MKVLHVLNHSVPHTDGYCIRTLNILRFQEKSGIGVLGITSPHHEPPTQQLVETIEGFRFYRTPSEGLSTRSVIHELQAIKSFKKRILEVASEEKPQIIHSHSPCLWGVAANSVAKRMRIPFVYEVRGIWEDASVDQGRITTKSLKYRLSRALESWVAKRAEAVIGISDGLIQEFHSRGVPKNQLWKIANGVDVDAFAPVQPDDEFRDHLGLQGRSVVAYIGSLYEWEGVDDLIRAFVRVHELNQKATLLIVGGGEILSALKSVAAECQLGDVVRFMGKVPHADILKYYSIADLLVYPRKRTRNVELVTPLKPLEAMALGKAIVGSDIGGIRELFPEQPLCIYPQGDSQALTDRILAFLADPSLSRRVGDEMREYVGRERRWDKIVAGYHAVYAALGIPRNSTI